MKKALLSVLENLRIDAKTLFLYIVCYLSLGFCMDAFGRWANIAWFDSRFQIISCYGLYLIPASLYVRKKNYWDQYLWGLFFLAPLEFSGYTIGSSVIAENNILDQLFSRANFSLAMVVFFGGLLPLGNFTIFKLSRFLNYK